MTEREYQVRLSHGKMEINGKMRQNNERNAHAESDGLYLVRKEIKVKTEDIA